MRWTAAVPLAAAATLVFGGCTSGAPGFPQGQWMLSSSGAVYLIDFRADGSAVATAGSGMLDQRQVDSFSYRTEGDTVTFEDDSSCRAQGSTGAGRYTWNRQGQELRLTVQEDGCEARRSLLDGAALASTPPPPRGLAVAPAVAEPAPWWNDAVFYEVFVRSFSDSDADGNGDLQGLIGKLDYLTGLGVNALWLMPIMQSPSYHGYDTTDYLTVEQDYGSNEDFAALMAAAHARDMHVIVDLVLNHTSSEHPWFAEAVADPAAARRDFYVWSGTDDGAETPWGTPVWHASPTGYYLGLFWEGMPDLDHRTGAVTEQLYDVARFWLQEMGADGFRLDAVRHLIEEPGRISGTAATHAWLREWDDTLDEADPQALTVGEVWDASAAVAPYVTGDEVDIAFEFSVAQGILRSVLAGDPAAFESALTGALAAYPAGQFAPFLTNHDQDRVMSQLSADVAGAKLAASALLALPGVPFIYYGEEIGMTGVKPDRRIRTPMQWDGSPGAGFTDGVPWQAPNRDGTSVAAQDADPDSLLSHYRALLAARSARPALRTGGLLQWDSGCEGVTVFVRGEGRDAVLVVLNFTDGARTGCRPTGPLDGEAPSVLADVLGSGERVVLTVDRGGRASVGSVALQPRQALLLVPAA